jgi:hypothetical protein
MTIPDEILKQMRENIMKKHLSNSFLLHDDPDRRLLAVVSSPLPAQTHYIANHVANPVLHVNPQISPLNDIIEVSKYVRVPEVKIQVTEFLPTRKMQARRHKRKSSRRWQKKWLKRFGTKEVRDSEIFRIGDTLLISPEMNRQIQKKLARQVSDTVDALNFQMLGF